jgi:hypothetical protein
MAINFVKPQIKTNMIVGHPHYHRRRHCSSDPLDVGLSRNYLTTVNKLFNRFSSQNSSYQATNFVLHIQKAPSLDPPKQLGADYIHPAPSNWFSLKTKKITNALWRLQNKGLSTDVILEPLCCNSQHLSLKIRPPKIFVFQRLSTSALKQRIG